ncbi:MAG: exopolysaccharide production protein ExoQ [Microbacteriaceae bacterium]|nr:exopolysaccharide production protein ExoQ [Microbacteriaceae bacterium]
MTAVAARPALSGTTGRPATGFDDPRVAVAFVAASFVLLSAPQVLNFGRLVPVAVVLVLLAAHLVHRSAAGWRSIRVPVGALLLAGWLGLTTLWSEGPFLSLVQTVSTGLVAALAVTLGSFVRGRDLIRGIAVGGVVVLLLSLALAVVSPADALMPAGYQGGALRGLYVHRNLLAEVLTPAFIAVLASAPVGSRPLFRRLVAGGFLLGGILLTRSSTALACVALVLVFAALLALVRRTPARGRPVALAAVLGLVAALGWYAVTNFAQVLALLQRDSTLTGRALIWDLVRRLIAQRPLGGWGWGAAWDDGDFVRASVQAVAHFDVPSAHNGYLDAWLQTGVVGLALFMLVAATVLLRGLGSVLRGADRLGVWAAAFVVGLLVYNVGEADLVSSLSIFLLITTLAVLGRAGAADRRPGEGLSRLGAAA